MYFKNSKSYRHQNINSKKINFGNSKIYSKNNKTYESRNSIIKISSGVKKNFLSIHKSYKNAEIAKFTPWIVKVTIHGAWNAYKNSLNFR